MGNNNVFAKSKFSFIEQLKLDSNSEQKILGIYLNPAEFPTSGLIIVTNKSISNFSPVNGYIYCSGNMSFNITLCDYNRKSKEGSLLAIITEDMKLSLMVTESLTIIRSLFFPYSKMMIRENSKITALNFELCDTVILGFTDGSVIKSKYNEEAFNLLYENAKKKNATSDEEEFENIKSVFSTDNKIDIGINSSNLISTDINLVEYLLVSKRYKILFVIQKYIVGSHKVNIFCLRNNRFEKTFSTIEGIVNEAKLIDKKDLLVIVVFNFERKQTTLEIWHYSERSCPIETYNISSLINYPFTVRSMSITPMPSNYYGRKTNHGVVDGDIAFLGTTRGDVIIGKIYQLPPNNKIGFDPFLIYKLRNDFNSGDQMSNKYEISFISFDLFIDVLMIGDLSSNVRIIEKILQIGKTQNTEDNLPFFSFFFDTSTGNLGKRKNKFNNEMNKELPLFSVNHDVIKDRSIIMYDQGRDITISSISDENTEMESKKEITIKKKNKDKKDIMRVRKSHYDNVSSITDNYQV